MRMHRTYFSVSRNSRSFENALWAIFMSTLQLVLEIFKTIVNVQFGQVQGHVIKCIGVEGVHRYRACKDRYWLLSLLIAVWSMGGLMSGNVS